MDGMKSPIGTAMETSLENADGTYTPINVRMNSVVDCRLTKREFIVAMAMQGMLANPAVSGSFYQIAVDSINQADEVMELLAAGTGYRSEKNVPDGNGEQ